jgi:hypothetical protein
MTSVMRVKTPISDLDPYSDPVLIDPRPTYAELQDAGPAVWRGHTSPCIPSTRPLRFAARWPSYSLFALMTKQIAYSLS